MKRLAWMRWLLPVIVTIILLEIASLALFKTVTNSGFSYSAQQSKRDRRIARLQEALDSDTGSTALYDYHPYLGYVGRPGAHPWGKSKPSFNMFGMVSPSNHPYPYQKKENELVVAILGGSVAEIFANQVEDTLNTLLHESFGFKSRFVLINLATGGYKQPQQLFHLEYALLSGFDIDVVVNIDGYNDLVMATENINHRINPVYPSGYHIGLLAKTWKKSNLDNKTISALEKYYSLQNRELFLLSVINYPVFRKSVFLNLLGETWSRHNSRKLINTRYNVINVAQSRMDREFRGPIIEEKGNKYADVPGIWQAASEMIQAICVARDITYIHILHPNQYVVDSKPLSVREEKIAINPRSAWGKIARDGYDQLRERGAELKKNGVLFYDLSRIFNNTSETLYIDDCCHFNSNGNTILATEIADILARNISE